MSLPFLPLAPFQPRIVDIHYEANVPACIDTTDADHTDHTDVSDFPYFTGELIV